MNTMLIKNILVYLEKKGITELIISGKSAMVISGNITECNILEVIVNDNATWTIVEELSSPNIGESGEVYVDFTIAKGIEVRLVKDLDLDIESIVKIGNLKVLNTDSLCKILKDTGEDRYLDILTGKNETHEKVRILKAYFRGCDDMTKIRIQMGNRLVATFKQRNTGITPGESEKEIMKFMNFIKSDYIRLTDGLVARTKSSFAKRKLELGDSVTVIDNFTELNLAETYFNFCKEEEKAIRRMDKLLEGIPIYDLFLSKVPGCGTKASAAIISNLDINKARYPSSFWKYCGLDVVKDPNTNEMVGKTMRKNLMVDTAFINADGEVTVTKNLGYNPEMKSRMTFILADCLIKSTGYYYQEVFIPYKQRLENHPKYGVEAQARGEKGINGVRRMTMAKRYMVKQFLADLFIFWKHLETGETVDYYAAAKLGREHGRKTFLDCLAESTVKGGKPEDYLGLRSV